VRSEAKKNIDNYFDGKSQLLWITRIWVLDPAGVKRNFFAFLRNYDNGGKIISADK
jgi:hypothetical protein